MPQALLINPPIYDFAAYDFWLKPLGLLSIAAILKKNNITVQLLDYLDRNHPALPPALSNEWGCGHYIMQEIPKPALLKQIPRQFKRYGMPADTARGILQKLSRPEVILVTSGMTYWYPGVQEAINEVKQIFPGVPVILGGIYATLCREHAERNSGADTVIPGSGLSGLKELLARLSVPLEVPRVFDDFPEPAYELYHKLDYVAIRTTVGCPFRCSYCAIQQLAPQGFQRKRADRVLAEIETLAGRGIKNIAFYDDALLFEAEQHIIPILEGVKKKGLSLSFHSPNGLHARFITPELARLLK